MLAIWIVVPAYYITTASVTTDIVNGVCLVWSAPPSLDVMNLILLSGILVGYLLPLALMIFCYSRIVYKLRTQVAYQLTARHHGRRLIIVIFIHQPNGSNSIIINKEKSKY